MRPAIGVAAMVLLGLTACSAGGTPSPTSVTISPSFHWATSKATAPTASAPTSVPATEGSSGPVSRTPPTPGRAILLTTHRVGPLALGAASPADTATVLDNLFGKPRSRSICAGNALAVTWGPLTVVFAGQPAVASEWEVNARHPARSLRLPRGTEWSPERSVLGDTEGATVTESGGDTVVNLADGLRYRFGHGDRRARTVGAGTPVCG